MRYTRSITFAVLCLLLSLTSCTFNNIEEDVAPPAPAVELCDTLIISFASDVQPIITRTCADGSFNANGGCHQSGAFPGDFTGYAGIKAKVDSDRFRARVLEQKNMPPSYTLGPASLTPAQLDTLNCWVTQGALDN